MKIDLNVKAPLFKLDDVYGRNIDLAAYRGRKVFLGFFRHAGCPFCNLRVHALSQLHTQMGTQGLDMIFFFESPARLILMSTFHQGVSPVPIISDPEKRWYDAYGLEESNGKATAGHLTSFVTTLVRAKLKGLPVHLMAGGEAYGTMPADFLLDEEGIIRQVHYSERLNDRLPLDAVAAFAARPARMAVPALP